MIVAGLEVIGLSVGTDQSEAATAGGAVGGVGWGIAAKGSGAIETGGLLGTWAVGAEVGCMIGNAPPITVRFGSGAAGEDADTKGGTKAGLSSAAMTAAMLSGRLAGSGCNM
jgi:hypothetical protein